MAIPEIAGYKQLSQLLVTQPIPTSIVHVQIDSDAQVLGEIPPYREESMVPGPYTLSVSEPVMDFEKTMEVASFLHVS